MKLATLRDAHRDGKLIVVRRDNAVYAPADSIAPSLQAALDDWAVAGPALEKLARDVESGEAATYPLDVNKLHSPLPRACEWIDGSAYINHIVLVRKARGAVHPVTLAHDPLEFPGGSGELIAPAE